MTARRWMGLVLAAMLLAAACGDDGDDGTDDSSDADVVVGEIDENKFHRENVPMLLFPSVTTTRIRVSRSDNSSALTPATIAEPMPAPSKR